MPQTYSSAGRITEEIRKQKGVPNYFGVQRFGEIRPVTHKVGEALVKGFTEEAVFIYLGQPFPGEPDKTNAERRALWENRNIPSALKSFPEYLHYELAMMNWLVLHPLDYAHCFDVLSSQLETSFRACLPILPLQYDPQQKASLRPAAGQGCRR